MTQQPTARAAAHWVHRWELQQQRYATAREERFRVIAEVVREAVDGLARPVIADLGCGPGSLAARLAERLPHARLLGVDHDPLLLALGRAHHGAAVTFLDVRLGGEGWRQRLAEHGPLDAVVSTTALHYLPPKVLAEVYEGLHGALRPGGLLVNADQLYPQDTPVRRLAEAVTRAHPDRRRTGGEDWAGWWRAVAATGEFAGLLAERDRRALGPGTDNGLTARRHLELLRAAGFEAAGSVWRYGHSCVLAAVRD